VRVLIRVAAAGWALVLSGCASWNRLTYVSTQSVTPRLPVACETTVTFTPGWDRDLHTRYSGVSPRPAALAASAQSAVAQDLASNLCGSGGTVQVEVNVQRLTYTANPSFFLFFPLPGFGAVLGLPILSLRSEAVVAVRVKRGATVAGEYQATSSEHHYMSPYYGRGWEPGDSAGGGIVAAALEHAVAEAKKRMAADRAAIAAAAGGPAGDRPGASLTVAVADLEANGVPATDAAVIANMLRGELVQTGAFRVVEKANMDKLLAEQAFQQTGCTTQECAVKLGRILNVKRMIVGSFGKLMGRYILSVRVVKVESGEVVQADEARGDTVDQLEASLKALASRLGSSAR